MKSSQTRYKQPKQKLLDFLDSSLLIQAQPPNEDFDNTLKILTNTKDSAARSKQCSSSADRNKVQMKYLNFHRKNVINKAQDKQAESAQKQKKRSNTAIRNKDVKEIV